MYDKESSRKEVARPIHRGKLSGWPIHLMIFVAFQLLFMMFDGSSIWHIFNMNNLGMRLLETLQPFFEHFQPYTSEQLNYVTAVWGVAVIGHGVGWFVEL